MGLVEVEITKVVVVVVAAATATECWRGLWKMHCKGSVCSPTNISSSTTTTIEVNINIIIIIAPYTRVNGNW